MPALNHALLGASVVALSLAALRLASRFTAGGLARLLSAAAFATAAAVAEALALGLLGLGGSTAALTIAALATAAATHVLLPPPALRVSDEFVSWWRDRPLGERLLLGAVGGAGIAWAVWQLRHPAIGFDAIHYHLPEIVIFVQGGHPGSIHDVLPGLPVGNYPLTTEVTIGWAAGIARSFVPLILWPWVTLALTATAAWASLRALAVPRIPAGLAAAALCTNPWLLGWQSNGSVTDPPALAWLVVTAALVAMSPSDRALLVPAVVAAGLAMGGKTTVLPVLVLVLAIGLWGGWRARELRLRPLAVAAVLATVIGGFWYLRNLVTHGSPFWPLVATPWGDPLPHSVQLVKTSFLDEPRATIDALHHAYLERFGGALIVLAAALIAPLAIRRRRVVLAGLVTLGGLLLWARAPVTGVGHGGAVPLETIFSATRYALPVVAAGCLALALATTDAPNRVLRTIALLVLGAAVAVNLVQTFRLHFPVAPSALTPLLGALAGAAVAAVLRPRRLPIPARAVAVLVAAAAALLAIPASGFVERHAATHPALVSGVVGSMAADPQFREGDSPVATTPAYIGPLAGDHLQHRLEALPASTTCAKAAARARSQWLVIWGGRFGGVAPAAVRPCLGRRAFDSGSIAVYRPSGG